MDSLALPMGCFHMSFGVCYGEYMTGPSAKEIAKTVAFAKTLIERMEHEPELAEQFIASIEERVLTEQPKESPKETYERLYGRNKSLADV